MLQKIASKCSLLENAEKWSIASIFFRSFSILVFVPCAIRRIRCLTAQGSQRVHHEEHIIVQAGQCCRVSSCYKAENVMLSTVFPFLLITTLHDSLLMAATSSLFPCPAFPVSPSSAIITPFHRGPSQGLEVSFLTSHLCCYWFPS